MRLNSIFAGFLGISLLLGSIPISNSELEVDSFSDTTVVSQMSETAILVLDNLPDPKSENERKKKFDSGFYDLVQEKIQNKTQTTEYYDVIIMVKKVEEEGLDKKTVANNNKNKLEYVLRNHYGVTEYYKAETLSFITARVPISEIPRLADQDFVGILGDGEIEIKPLSLNMDEAKISVNSIDVDVTGKGVIVSVLDTGIKQNPDHPDLPIPTKVIKQIRCVGVSCDPNGDTEDEDDHGTHQAGIISGLGIAQGNMKGIAPDSLLYVVYTISESGGTSMANALDWSLTNGADVANISLAGNTCVNYPMISEIIDEAIDEGLIVITAAGNSGPTAETIKAEACGLNTISTGAFDDKNTEQISDDVVWGSSSRGPTPDDRLKPEILAPGVSIYSHSGLTGVNYNNKDGTSFAAPFVSGASALILEQNSYYRPLEIKAALLLGADWKGTVSPITAQTYDFGSDNAALNANGFGFLNIENSLDKASSGNNIIYDTFDLGTTTSKEYTFTATQGEEVKIILSWFHHPTGTIIDPTSTDVSNIDLVVKNSSGNEVILSRSTIQNNEFLVFDASESGTHSYTIEVDPIDIVTEAKHPFVLASSKPLTAPCPSFPPSGTWIIDKTCLISGTVNVPINLNVKVMDESDLVVLNGGTLNIDFTNKKLEIISGSRVIVKEGATIT
ncbi:MAG TPA: S8 family serine peptidase [Nitrosopumilaceae archaeon]|nr:S8 family serine peptidase [Nitrosopumilaceae archaeon]